MVLKCIEQIPEIIFNQGSIISGGWLILEHSDEYDFSQHKYFSELRKYSLVNFSIFKEIILTETI
jgi:hypothetical protein